MYFVVPMSTIDDYWSMFVPPPVARGRLRSTLGYDRQGALCCDLIGCAHSEKLGDIRVFYL